MKKPLFHRLTTVQTPTSMAAPPAPQNFRVIDCTKMEKQPQSLKALAIAEAIVGFFVVLFTIIGIGIYGTNNEFGLPSGFLFGCFIVAGVVDACCGGLGIVALWCRGQSGLVGPYFVMCVIACNVGVVILLILLIPVIIGVVFDDGSYDSDGDDRNVTAMIYTASVFIFVHMICVSVSIHFMRILNRGAVVPIPPVVCMQNPAGGQNPGVPSVEMKQFSFEPPPAQYASAFGYQAPAALPTYQYQQSMLPPPAYPYPMAQPATYPPPMPGRVYGQ